jgi:hypothetical protein
MTAFGRRRRICSHRSISKRARPSAPRFGYSLHEPRLSTLSTARTVAVKRWAPSYRGMKSSPRTVVVVLATSGHERLSAANGPDRFTATNELRELLRRFKRPI